jgi:ubiquinone/menaquinone biosynthesis C-methylase UbiE
MGFVQPNIAKAGLSWQEEVRASWRAYMVDTLGLTEREALQRAEDDITGEGDRSMCDGISQKGWRFAQARILDVGSGHGTLCLEMARRGAQVVGLEPCAPWRELAVRRAAECGLSERITFCDGDAHCLPFPDIAFDAVVSLQVLEHVERPRRVIAEIARVLKPSGRFLLTCENYLASHEGHYRLPWFPLMPGFLAVPYLRSRGRNPAFFREHIRYTIHPLVTVHLIRNQLVADRWSGGWARIRNPEKITRRLPRQAVHLAKAVGLGPMLRYAYALWYDRRRWFAIGSKFLGTKQALGEDRADD